MKENYSNLVFLINAGKSSEALSILSKMENVPNRRSYAGMTALHLIAGAHLRENSWWTSGRSKMEASERAEITRLLLNKNAKTEIKDGEGRTPLHWAAESFYVGVVAALLDFGADATAKDTAGRTPLHLIPFQRESAEDADFLRQKGGAIVALLTSAGADVNARDNKGRTPLHEACGSPTLAEILIENGADVNALSKNGDSPAHEAIRANRTKSLDLLASHGASMSAKNKNGKMPEDVGQGKAAEMARVLRERKDLEAAAEKRQASSSRHRL